MEKPAAKKIIIPKWRYACIDCGRCCRDWHVELMPGEDKRLAALKWGDADAADIPPRRLMRIAGGTYVAHKENGECIYYNAQDHACHIHQKFGYDAKPLGCRIYPFSITPAPKGVYSCIGRFDCPAVRACKGPPIQQRTDEIRQYIAAQNLPAGVDNDLLDGLEPGTLDTILTMLDHRILHHPSLSGHDRAVAAIIAVNRIEVLGEVFLNDVELNDVLPSFFDRAIKDRREMKQQNIGRFEQLRFLSVLTSYLRRDEEYLGQGAWIRAKRFGAILQTYFGKANLHNLGSEHPDAPLDRRILFSIPVENRDRVSWDLLWDLIRLRLESRQFFGPAVFDLSLFVGLKSLLLMAPLVMALAKWRALIRDVEHCRINEEDVAYAIGAIDHGFGRSALLGYGTIITLTRQMSAPEAYARLVDTIVSPQ